MKDVTRVLLLWLFATLVLQSPLTFAFHKPGHIPPTGTCRDDPCPCSEADKEKIKGLIGRLRALKEVADLTRKEYNEAVKKRDMGRDAIWSESEAGSLMNFSTALLLVAANTPAQAGNKWKVVREVGAWAGTAGDIVNSPDEFSTWVGTGSQAIGSDIVMDQRAVQKVFYAGEKAADMFRVTRDPKISSKVFYEYARGSGHMWFTKPVSVEPVKNLGTLVSVLMALDEFKNATNALANDLSAYFEARREAKQLQAQLDRIDEQIEEILKELEELRKRCPAETPSPDKFKKSSGSGPLLLVSVVRLSASSPADDQEDARLEAALNTMMRLQAHLDRIHPNVWENLVNTHLSPFIVGAWKDMPPPVVWEVMHDGVPALKALPDELDETVELANEVIGMLKPLH
jgi:hypothetical protein